MTHKGGCKLTNKSTQRVNINMGVEMHSWLKDVSNELNISVSALIIMAVHNFRMQNTVVPQLEDILKEIKDNE